MLKFFKKIDLEKKLFTMPLNWAGILAFVAFWTYGFFGTLSSGSRSLNITIFPVLLAIFLLFLFFWQKGNKFFKDELVFRIKDLLVLSLLFLFLFPLSLSNLSNSLNGDELAHAQQAELHGISLTYLLAGKFGFLNNLSFADVLWTINFLILLFAAAFYLFLKNKSFSLKVLAFSAVFILSRLLVLRFGGSGGPHPPFRLFPLWLSGTIFYPADFSFRLAQFLGLIILGWIIWRFAEKRAGFVLAFLVAASSITIPVLWHAGILAEQSVWTAIAWSLVLLYMYLKPELEVKDYLRLVVGISVATLMRQTAFVAFLPVFLRLAYDIWKKKISLVEAFMIFSPVLVTAPFLLGSFVSGTPASYISGEAAYVPAGMHGLARVWFAVKSGIIWTAITNSVKPVWLVFVGIPLIFFIKKPRKLFELTSFFVCGASIFYLINPNLWGVGRYQAEYVAPFAVFGLALVAMFIKEKMKVLKYVLLVGLLALIAYNVYVFKNIPKANPPADILVSAFSDTIKKRGEYSIITEFPYDYRFALAGARAGGYADSVYIAGSTYGVFPEILAGFTVREVTTDKKLTTGGDILRNSALPLSPEEITSDKNIKLVLISDDMNRNFIFSQLETLGWTEWKNFKNEEYGATTIGLIRKQVPLENDIFRNLHN
jgi:hypothetical protein